LDLIISVSFEAKDRKYSLLNSARIKIEVLKRIVRTAYELNIIKQNKYLELENDLIEISKMANGWIRYLTKSP